MNGAEIFVGILAIAIVATDITVRLAIAPHRRDEQLGELINNLNDPVPTEQIGIDQSDPEELTRLKTKR